MEWRIGLVTVLQRTDYTCQCPPDAPLLQIEMKDFDYPLNAVLNSSLEEGIFFSSKCIDSHCLF